MESIRTCIICGKRDKKENLVRFSFAEGRIQKDPNKKISGRGFYLHKEHEATEETILRIWQKRRK